MFRTSILLLCATAACAQQPECQLMAGSLSSKSGVTFRFKSMLHSSGVLRNDNSHGLGEGGVTGVDNGMTRVMVDSRSQSYFGYDLVVVPADEPATYVATFQPPSNAQRLLGRGGVITDRPLKPMPLPAYPPPMVVHDGDTIALDLMVSADGRQRVTDYIEVYARKPEPGPATTTIEPQDFTVDDGPVTFDPMLYTIWAQGQKYAGGSGFTGKPGATFWIAFPGQGRYILSLVPHPAFVLSGAIRDNVVVFRDGSQEFEVRFLNPIAGSGKAWNLYMMHDLTYQPKSNQRNMIAMGTDRLENLLPTQGR